MKAATHGVRISRGTVTHWVNGPITSWEMARDVRNAILDYLGEEGEIVEIKAQIALPPASVSVSSTHQKEGK